MSVLVLQLRRNRREEVLAGEELLVHVLGQRRLRSDGAEGQQLRRGHLAHPRHPRAQEGERRRVDRGLPDSVRWMFSYFAHDFCRIFKNLTPRDWRGEIFNLQ